MGIVLLEVIIVTIIALIVYLCYKKGLINLIIGGLIVLSTIILATIFYKSVSNNISIKNAQSDENKSILTEETINRLKKIDEDIIIQLINMNSSDIEFAKEYEKVSRKITIEEIEDLSERTDLQDKYDLISTDSVIIVKNGEREKILEQEDLYRMEFTTYERIDTTEEAITNAIIGVTLKDKPNLYILTGKTYYMPEKDLGIILNHLKEESYEVDKLNILAKRSIPEDCDCLIITTLKQDLSTLEKNEILKYISKGGKILILTSQNTLEIDTPNFDEILAQYGITIEYGTIIEQDSKKMLYESPNCIVTEAKANFLEELNMTLKICAVNLGKIQFADKAELEKLGITYEIIATTSEKSFVRTNFDITSTKMTSEDSEETNNIIAASVSKNISNGINSQLVIYSNELFASNTQIDMGGYYSLIELYNNKDVISKSVSYLTEREDLITIRKRTSSE